MSGSFLRKPSDQVSKGSKTNNFLFDSKMAATEIKEDPMLSNNIGASVSGPSHQTLNFIENSHIPIIGSLGGPNAMTFNNPTSSKQKS